MVRRRVLELAAFAAAAAGGATLAYVGDRRVAAERAEDDPERRELARQLPAEAVPVDAFDGTRLRAEVLGPAGAGSIVLVHGLALAQDVWHYQRRDLSGRFRVVSFDLRGHGRSEEAASGDYSAAALGRDVAAVLRRCVPEGTPVVLVGHSLGGIAALSCLDQFPEMVGARVAGLALVSTASSRIVGGLLRSAAAGALSTAQAVAGSRVAAWQAARQGKPADQAMPGDLAYVLTRQFGLNPDATPAQVEFVERLNRECGNTVKAALGSTLSGVDLVAAAGLAKVPSLVLVGTADRLTPPAQARRLAKALPDARMVEVPDAGHTVMLEAHEVVTASLGRFADEVLEGKR